MVFETDVDSKYVPAIGSAEDDEFRDTIDSVTGGLGAVFRATPELHLTANYARGFRQNAPNFGTRQLGDGILIPNQLLDPTTVDNVEVGVKGQYPGLRFDAAYYHSFIDNWQGDLRPTTFNGSSFLDFNRNGTRDANGGLRHPGGGRQGVRARRRGARRAAAERVPAGCAATLVGVGKLRLQHRQCRRDEGQPDERAAAPHAADAGTPRSPLGRRSTISTAVSSSNWWRTWSAASTPSRAIGNSTTSRGDARPQDGSSPLLRDYIGTPGYTIFSVHAGINLAENVRVRVGVENLTDKKYRVAQSRHGRVRDRRLGEPGVRLLRWARTHTGRGGCGRGSCRSRCMSWDSARPPS